MAYLVLLHTDQQYRQTDKNRRTDDQVDLAII
jgi:hypothetical protein